MSFSVQVPEKDCRNLFNGQVLSGHLGQNGRFLHMALKFTYGKSSSEKKLCMRYSYDISGINSEPNLYFELSF